MFRIHNKVNVHPVIQQSTVFFFALPRLQLYAAVDFVSLDLVLAVLVIQVLAREKLLHL